MRLSGIIVAFMLLHGTPATAQPAEQQILKAALRWYTNEYDTGSWKLDKRVVPAQVRAAMFLATDVPTHAPSLIAALAVELNAHVASKEDLDRCLGMRDAACMRDGINAFVAVSKPSITGDSVSVLVRTFATSSTVLPTVGGEAWLTLVEVVLRRDGGVWRVVRHRELIVT